MEGGEKIGTSAVSVQLEVRHQQPITIEEREFEVRHLFKGSATKTANQNRGNCVDLRYVISSQSEDGCKRVLIHYSHTNN
jgi:hypothetical protein